MKKTLLLLTMCALTAASFAQNATNRWGVGAGVAFTDFVNPINGQYLMLERYKGALNLNIQRYLGKSFDGRFNFTQGTAYYPYYQLGGSPQALPTSYDLATKGKMEYNLAELWDGGLNLVYKFNNGYILKENASFAPYIFSGLGANLINQIGNNSRGTTEGGAGSDNVNPYIPFGIGFAYHINEKWSAAFETSYKAALGDAYDYTQTNLRLGYNFGGAAAPAAADAATAASTEPMPNENWCSRNWSVGAGASFVSYEGPVTGQNFLLDQYTTLLGLNIQKRINKAFDARLNGAFGNVWYPNTSRTNYPGYDKYLVSYRPAQMVDVSLEGVFKFAGTLLKENAIFAPYIYAGPSVNWISSIGTWDNAGADDINMSVSTGLGFNFRTSDRFSIQLEAGRKWKVDNSFDYNQANLRGMYALGSCGSAAAATTVASTTKVADSDGDGIADNVDECPYVAGKPEFFGCPDSDGDGLGDSKDKCPFDKGSAANQGCPDAATTPNTVAPTTPTTPTETPAAPAKQNKLVQGFEVFFANGTTFAPNQVETLQKVATLLKNNPNYTVVINGNAYKGGSKALSLQRAEKVAGTLRMKGVNVSNAKTEGFGDTRAKYNNTKDNRAEIEVYSFE